jgi:hypothetical protein
MENIQFEITHARVIALLAKQLNVLAEQIDIKPLTADDTSAVVVVVRTDMQTANKIDKKLKRLEGGEPEDG